MAFWNRNSEDPWDRDPNERPAVTFREAEPEETAPEEPKEAEPAPEPCPWCGGEMETGYLLSGKGLVRLTREKPHLLLGTLFAETIPLKDEGPLSDWMTYWKTCAFCAACRRIVVDAPELDWERSEPAPPPEDDGSTEAYERYMEQLKHYR